MTVLVGWWPLHENSGSASDLSGKDNHGSLNGGVIQGVSGKAGLTSYSFDGSDDLVEISDASYLRGGNNLPIAVSCWFRVDNLSSNQYLVQKQWDGSDGDWGLTATSDGKIRWYGEDGGNDITLSGGSVSSNTWHHAAFVLESKQGPLRIYLDGGLVAEQTYSESISSNQSGNVYIGARIYNNDPANDSIGYANASIGDVRVYDRILSDREIQTLYKWGSGDYTDRSYHDGSDSGAVSRWKFNGEVTDSWGSNDGTDKTSAGFSSNAIRGQAKKFDGDDDYVNLGDMGGLGSNSSQLTYSIWMSNDDTARRNLYGFNKDNSSTHNIQINSNTDNNNDPGNLRYIFKDSGGSALRANLSQTVPLNSGSLNHLVFTQDLSANRLKFYFNSSSIPIFYSLTQTPSAEDFPMDLYLGNQNYKGSANTPISGVIDEFRIYNRVLEPHEVFQLYQWGTRGRDMRKLTVNQR